MEATAKFDYDASAEDELSFRKGELLVILQTSGDWFKAQHGAQEGLVPKNFISIHLPSWYQEDSSRREARDQLMEKPEGSFLIRGSKDAAQGTFSISVRCEADVQHFRVLRDSRGRYYLWMEKFPSLNQLVEYYKYTSISKKCPVFLKEEKQQKQQQQPPPQRQQQQPPPPQRQQQQQPPPPQRQQQQQPPPPQRQQQQPPPPQRQQQQQPPPPQRQQQQQPPPPPQQQQQQQPPQRQQQQQPPPPQRQQPPPPQRQQQQPPPPQRQQQPPPPQRQQQQQPKSRRGSEMLPRPTPSDDPPTSAARQVKAVYSFVAEEKDELEFEAGDVIEVVECSDPTWWRGRLGGRTGLFPSNYTEPL